MYTGTMDKCDYQDVHVKGLKVTNYYYMVTIQPNMVLLNTRRESCKCVEWLKKGLCKLLS